MSVENSEKPAERDSGTGAVITGLVLFLLGFVVAFFPLWIARANTAPGHNWMSEGDPASGGAAIWGLMITVPMGGLVGLLGLIVFFVGLNKAKPTSPEPEDPDSL
ncbi:MAG: hypothetical protein KGL41_04895 [Actinomycetales bacterium]|nr:hypothetical protein [Actinomycetales bacterium]